MCWAAMQRTTHVLLQDSFITIVWAEMYIAYTYMCMCIVICIYTGFPGDSAVKNLPAMQETMQEI